MQLNVNDLGLVQKEIFEARTKWYDIGLQLNIPVHTLDSIQSQFSDPKDYLREILKAWLKTDGKTTWKTLVNALRSQTVDESRLAARLEGMEALVKEDEEQARQTPDLKQQVNGLKQQVNGLHTENQQLKQQLLEARAQNRQEENDVVRQELETSDQQLQEKDQLPVVLEASSQNEIQPLRHELEERDCQTQETKETQQSEIQQFKPELESRDQQQDRKIQEKDEPLVARQEELGQEAEKSPVTKKRRPLHLQTREQSWADNTRRIPENVTYTVSSRSILRPPMPAMVKIATCSRHEYRIDSNFRGTKL